MYQLEVKRWIVQHCYPPSDGWVVSVHIDAMERAIGGSHHPDKKAIVEKAEAELVAMRAAVGSHNELGPADIVAEHPIHGTVVIEVEGYSSRQPEQALYSALGQLALVMNGRAAKYVLAFPDEPSWERQADKLPRYLKERLDLRCALVSMTGVKWK